AACTSSHRISPPPRTSPAPATAASSAAAPARPALAGPPLAAGDLVFPAAPLAGRQATPASCLRSVKDYPSLVATALGAHVSLVNVSCYGATTRDLTQAQHPAGQSNPAQLSALSAADRLVTVQIGGDDIGFGKIAATCGALSLTSPT